MQLYNAFTCALEVNALQQKSLSWMHFDEKD